MLFRPSESSKRITEFYRRYLLTTFGTNNEVYNKQLKEALEKEGTIADGPYISMSDPYEKGKTLMELAEEGIISKEILKIKNFHVDRPLYRHQEEAVRKAVQGKNLIVTTGTGSGKTESFLIPIINQLLKEKEEGTLGPGVRTLIIYPMNALVNDQVRRLRELLAEMEDEPKITFGRFTGETEETYKKALEKYAEVEDIFKNPPCENELISREQMRVNPPNILITNYAMLEYMLLRPGDNIIFSEENANNWKYIVFDEAHSYGGAKGIEVASLVKRVKAMLKRDDIKFILTSATLGGEKENKEIIHFAETLCTANFDDNSIIRSHTVEVKPTHNVSKLSIELYRELANQIRNNYADYKIIETINRYGVETDSTSDVSELLFDMILHDDFYFKVRSVLNNQIKTLSQVSKELQIDVDDFTDFIAVASNAMRNNERLFEAKYHMFLRGIEGIYVTLNPSNKLFINRMEVYKEKPYDEADMGYKVYEVSFCSNCNALFITGQEEEGFLVQKSKVNDEYKPDVFLINGEFDDDDTEDDSIYHLCSKCGAIKRASSLNGLQCGHGTEYINKIIRVKKSGDKLHSCPCCHSVNGQRSILRPYFLGTEAATAVIATALYSELPSVEHKITIEEYEDDFFGEAGQIEKDEQIELKKQFLAFSDNRQTAAFFASYLENTYRDSLVKRIVNELVEEKKERFEDGVSLETFVSLLAEKFQQYNVFPEENEDYINKEAWIYTLKEVSNFKAKNSLMKKGILMFDLDISLAAPKGLNLSSEEMTTVLKILCKSMMKDVAISSEVHFSDAQIERFTVTGFRKGYSKTSAGKKGVVGWSPETGKTNKRLKYVTKVLEGDEETARKLLDVLWDQMERSEHEWVTLYELKYGKAHGLNHKKIKAKKIEKLYICDECKGITPYNVKGICDNPKCNGHLIEYDYKTSTKNDHYYNLFTNLNITPMSVKEHTAQLSSDRAYQYQKDFKEQKINVLSCSTTFEMGVDVGSLETVFMRNMPPSPANYAQRAGRAGRSLKSAAYAITFCPNNSHDLNYFKNPVAMIKGTIQPPFFNVSNDKIVLRHIFASAFSHFWKIYPDMYKDNIGEFVDAKGFEKLQMYLELKPEALKCYLQKIVPADLQDYFKINSFGWVKVLFCEDNEEKGLCNIVIDKYVEDLTTLERAKKELNESGKTGVDKITRSINTIKAQRIIEFLSKNNLIPKYGFPVDTVELKGSALGSSSTLSLNRDLFSAISEYAPDSEIVADGQLLKSRYVRKLTGYEWPKYNYKSCPNCLTLTKASYVTPIKECKQCGQEIRGRIQQYIIPKFGFLTDTEEPKPVGMNKPERTYKGAIAYIGDENKIAFHEYTICGHRVLLGNSKMDSLAVLNESPFYICESCGYGKLHEDSMDSVISYKHPNPNGYRCGNETLRRYSLGHEFQTDVALIKFVDFNVSKKDVAWTVLYSMLEGLRKNMNIDRNELSGCLQWYRDIEHEGGNFSFVLFDNTPGGAGYVRQLENAQVFADMLKEAYKIVSNCNCGGELADTACYSCLCNYYNQRQHEILKRKYAIEFYQQFSNSYDSEWTYSRNEEVYVDASLERCGVKTSVSNDNSKEHFQLNFCNEGRNQMSDTASEIWEDLLEDCEEEETFIIKNIRDKDVSNIAKPIYGEVVEIIETGERFYVRELWKEKKVMLFLSDDMEDYAIAKKTGWNCYCTVEEFDVDEFLKRIEV